MAKAESDSDTVISASWEQSHSFRLRHHHLAQRAPSEALVTVVREVGGIQAQVLSAAQIALWARVQGLTPDDVERALWQERTLVKTWCMRGTVHLVPAKDLLIYAGALKRDVLQREQRWLAKRGVGPREIRVTIDAILEALSDGPLTRRELGEEVVALLGPQAKQWIEHSWGGLVKQACLQGLVCFGPDRGRYVTFVRRDQWLPDLDDVPVEEAEEVLLRRYLHSYGPAAPTDFAAWTGMRVRKGALPIWKRLEDELDEVTIDGEEAWILHRDVAQLQTSVGKERNVCLLPSFDSYMLGHRDKDHLVDEAHYKRIYRKAGWLSPVVLVNGRAVGVWSHDRRGERLCLTVEPFYELSQAVRDGIELEARDLGRFLGGACEIAYTAPDLDPVGGSEND